MGDSSQKNFYEVIRALESGRTYKRPKVQAGVTIEEVSQVQPQPIALPATIATHEAVRAGLNAEVVETFAARDEAFPTSEGAPSDPRLTVSPAAQDRSGTTNFDRVVSEIQQRGFSILGRVATSQAPPTPQPRADTSTAHPNYPVG